MHINDAIVNRQNLVIKYTGLHHHHYHCIYHHSSHYHCHQHYHHHHHHHHNHMVNVILMAVPTMAQLFQHSLTSDCHNCLAVGYAIAITRTLVYACRQWSARLSLLNSAVACSCGSSSRDTLTSPGLCTLPLRGSGSTESSQVLVNWMPPTEIKQYIFVGFLFV